MNIFLTLSLRAGVCFLLFEKSLSFSVSLMFAHCQATAFTLLLTACSLHVLHKISSPKVSSYLCDPIFLKCSSWEKAVLSGTQLQVFRNNRVWSKQELLTVLLPSIRIMNQTKESIHATEFSVSVSQ